MACWQDQTLPLLRVMIDDMDSTDYSFSDARLEQTLIVAAHYINQEIDFDATYVISNNNQTITPDPSEAPDDAFMNFMVLKAACLIDIGSARTAAMTAGLESKCGPAVMKTLRRMDGFATLLDKGACASYEQLKKEYRFGNVKWAKGILSPFINKNFFPTDAAGDLPFNDIRTNR